MGFRVMRRDALRTTQASQARRTVKVQVSEQEPNGGLAVATAGAFH
jgi:hypothetical protein